MCGQMHPTSGMWNNKISPEIYFTKMSIPTWEHSLKFLWRVGPNSFLILIFHWWWTCLSSDYRTGKFRREDLVASPKTSEVMGWERKDSKASLETPWPWKDGSWNILSGKPLIWLNLALNCFPLAKSTLWESHPWHSQTWSGLCCKNKKKKIVFI